MGKQKFTSEVVVEGADQAAKDFAKVVAAQAKLADETERTARAYDEAAENALELAASERILEQQARSLQDETEGLSGRFRKAERRWRDAGGAASSIAWGLAKVVVAIRSTVAALRLLPAIGAVVQGGMAIVQVLRDEIAARERLAEVIKLQSRAHDELRTGQIQQQETLERRAGQRSVGGFDTDTARRVQAAAAGAQKQFTQLQPQDIDAAFGIFGDIEGLSQKDLTDLAIIAGFGELKVDLKRSRAALKARADTLLRRFRESGRITTFAQRETVQGEGVGAAEFRPAGPTERAQEVAEQAATAGGPKAQLREHLRKVLPPGTDIERAVKLLELFGTAGELEAAKVGLVSARPLTTLFNRARIDPLVEIGLPDQPGIISGALEAGGLISQFETLRQEEFEALLEAMRAIEKAGLPGAGQANGGDITININHLENSKNLGPDAASDRGRAVNSELRSRRQSERPQFVGKV